MATGLEEAFGGGGYTALQRSALLHLAWDHISSGLDGRESAFELHANGGIPAWRNRLRAWFNSYNELANGVLDTLGLEMPRLDFTGLRRVPQGPRRQVQVSPVGPSSATAVGGGRSPGPPCAGADAPGVPPRREPSAGS
jgi:4-hydroxyphenylacetate 3-monooxygenase